MSLRLQVRYRRVPTSWEVVPDRVRPEQPVLRPRVRPHAFADAILDPFEVRNRFLSPTLLDNRDATLKFLSDVGLWDFRPHGDGYISDVSEPPTPVTDVDAGLRTLKGVAIPVSLAKLAVARHEWDQRIRLLKKPQQLSKWFQQYERNNLNLHLDWSEKSRRGPQAVIEVVSVTEMLLVTLQIDMLNNSKLQTCLRHDCGTAFTGRERTYCSEHCAKIVAMRKYRDRLRQKQSKENRKGWI